MKTPWVVWLANGLGLGLSPIASGTVGSLWGVLLVILLDQLPGLAWYIAASVLLSVLAIPICGAAEKHYGKKDDGRVVAR